MINPLVTPDHPAAILEGVLPEYTREGIAVDYADLIHCQQGEALISVNFEPVPEKAGTVVFLFPGDVVKVEQVSADFHIEYLVCSEDILKVAAANLEPLVFDILRQHNHLNNEYATQVASQTIRYARILNLRDGGPYAREAAALLLRSVFLCYNNYLSKNDIHYPGPSNRAEILFSRFMYYLGRHYRESRDVAFYAAQLNMTTKYLTNIVSAKTGHSAKQAIDTYVIMQLRSALQGSDRPVKEIAWDFNFSSTAFFCDFFKRHTGLTPLEFREKVSISQVSL